MTKRGTGNKLATTDRVVSANPGQFPQPAKLSDRRNWTAIYNKYG